MNETVEYTLLLILSHTAVPVSGSVNETVEYTLLLILSHTAVPVGGSVNETVECTESYWVPFC